MTSIKFSLLISNDEKKSAIHMTADLQNCPKSLQTENQSQLGGLGTLRVAVMAGRHSQPLQRRGHLMAHRVRANR